MSRSTTALTPELWDYLIRSSSREPEALEALRSATSARDDARMQTSPEQGQFLHLLCRLIGARRVLEVGTFTGYSAAWMALALPEDGRLLTCDIDSDTTEIARQYWRQSGVEARIESRIGEANETLRSLRATGEEASFDVAYIDADKTSYAGYFEDCLALVRRGGLIAVDNVLWGGRVIDPDDSSDDTVAIRAFNAALRSDERVDLSMVPIGDGLTLARRR